MPIFDAIGRPIAFGGRILPGSRRDDATADAKYLNSPESALFHKSRTLFGLNLAKKPIIDSRTAVIVEGYTDVIACHQAGFANVVATLGTALTRDHAAELRRFCDRVVLVFDADEAGQKAADRALEVFFAEPIDVGVAVLPEGKDPADLLGEPEGPSRWEQAIRDAEDAMTFHHRRVREAFDAAGTMTARQRIGEAYLRTLVQLGLRQLEPARRGLVYSQVADLLKLDRGTIDRMVRDLSAKQRRPAPAGQVEPAEAHEVDPNAVADDAMAELAEQQGEASPGPAGRRQAERLIVGCLLADPTLFHAEMADGRELAESVLPGDLNHLPTRRLYQTVHDWLVDHDQLDPGDLRAVTEDEKLIREAFNLRDEVERICDEDAGAIARRLHAAARRLADFQA
jgi:DNA primase